MKKLLLPILVMTVIASSCDTHHEDIGPSFEVELLVIPGGPSILNPSQVIGKSVEDVKLLSGSRANIGDIDLVTDYNFIRYLPKPSFQDGGDSFFITIVDKQGESHSGLVKARMLSTTECSDNGIFDFIQVKVGQSFEIDLLANDVFCGGPVNISSGSVNIYALSVPSETATNNLNIHLNLVNETVTLTYTAPKDVIGKIEFIYEVGINAHGPMRDTNGNIIVSSFNKYVIAQATIEIVE